MSGHQGSVTAVEGDAIAFRFSEYGARDVRLWCDLDLGTDLDLAQVENGWELRIPAPEVDCLEYLFEVTRPDGSTEMVLDQGNPQSVDGAFGAHSWLALPTYAAPEWLTWEPVAGERHDLSVRRTPVGVVDVQVWQPEGSGKGELPLLVAHDGPEMDKLGELTRYVGAMAGAGTMPAMRVALVSPGARNERYAAHPAYAQALTDHVVPAITREHPAEGLPVLSGQSLGALAALHAAWTQPGVFGGLLLQSGSFFTPETDAMESGFDHWTEVTGFVQTALTAAEHKLPPTVLTCGTAEENLANNRLLLAHLQQLGADVRWGETRQGHTWTNWRDLLHPHLTDLLTDVWGA